MFVVYISYSIILRCSHRIMTWYIWYYHILCFIFQINREEEYLFYRKKTEEIDSTQETSAWCS